MKKYIIITIAICWALLVTYPKLGNSKITSPPADSSGAPVSNATCAQSGCHGGPVQTNTASTLTILNIGTGNPTTPLNSSFAYTPGTVYNIVFGLTSSTGRYGFQIVPLTSTNAMAGSFTVTSASTTQINTISGRQYMGHKSANTTKNWTFKWTAPAAGAGAVTFYYAYNTANSDNNPSGDTIYKGSVTINQATSVSATLGANQTTCSGSGVTLSPTVSGGQSPYSYSWSSVGNSLSCSNCQNPTATITQNSTFYVTVTDANNNTASTSVLYTNTGPCPQCISGSSACIPTGGPANGGFEDPNSTSCAVQGTAYSHAIQFTLFNVFNFLGQQTVDSMEFLSIENLPCGLCWALNQADKRYTANEDGCLSISGTTTDAAGQYKLAIAMKAWINGQATGQTIPASLVDQTGIRLFLRVKTALGSCANVDTSVTANNLTASISCGQVLSVNLGSNQTVCSGTSITLNPTITGGQVPYTYSWSSSGNFLSCNSCQNPTATITQNSTFTITVTDNNNITSSASITYTVGNNNFNITANGPTTFCSGGSVVLNAGNGYTNYLWSNNSTASTLTVNQGGTYSVTVTANGGCTLTDNQIVTVNTPTISNYQIVANGPTSFCNGGSVTLNAGTGFSSYLWSNNSTSQTITVSQTANYLVTVLGTDGCTYTDAQNVNTNTSFNGQQICIVTVDPATGKNVIVWEKSGGFGIDSFKIYRETNIANNYQLIRKQYFSNFSTYEDGLSNPQQASDRYVITTVDACGESAYGTPHQTIHLTSNVGINNEVNLIWNDYEGFSYPSFNIYRGSSQGNMQQITSVSSNTFSYSDLTPPGPPLYYQIEVVNPNGCVPTAKTESYGSSLSNIVQLSTLSVGANNQDDLIKAYCYYNENSSENIVRINFKGPPSGSLKLYDVSGRVAFTISDITSKEIQLPNTLSKGIYVADINTQNFSSRNKIFIR